MYGMMGCKRASVSQVSLSLFIRGSISPWRWSLWILDYQEASNTQWSSCLRPLRAWIQILARIPDLFHGCWDPDSSPLFHSSRFRIAKPPPLPLVPLVLSGSGQFSKIFCWKYPYGSRKACALHWVPSSPAPCFLTVNLCNRYISNYDVFMYL